MGDAFKDIEPPLSYYQEGGPHDTDGGKTPFEKEAFRNWKYAAVIIDKRSIREDKSCHWIRTDYEAKDPSFKGSLPEYRVKELQAIMAGPINEYQTHVNNIVKTESESRQHDCPLKTAQKLRCLECETIARPDSIKFEAADKPGHYRWAHYYSVYRRLITHEEKYQMNVKEYRPRRKERREFYLRIDRNNFPTAAEYTDLRACSAVCHECDNYFYKYEMKKHHCQRG